MPSRKIKKKKRSTRLPTRTPKELQEEDQLWPCCSSSLTNCNAQSFWEHIMTMLWLGINLLPLFTIIQVSSRSLNNDIFLKLTAFTQYMPSRNLSNYWSPEQLIPWQHWGPQGGNPNALTFYETFKILSIVYLWVSFAQSFNIIALTELTFLLMFVLFCSFLLVSFLKKTTLTSTP